MEERLLRYNEIKAEIDKLKWKIAIKEREEVQASGPMLEVTGIKPQGYKSSSVENEVVRNVDEINMYKKQIEELEAEIRMIDSMINTLKDFYKEIIIAKYISRKSIADICSQYKRTEKTVYRIISRSLRYLERIYNK